MDHLRTSYTDMLSGIELHRLLSRRGVTPRTGVSANNAALQGASLGCTEAFNRHGRCRAPLPVAVQPSRPINRRRHGCVNSVLLTTTQQRIDAVQNIAQNSRFDFHPRSALHTPFPCTNRVCQPRTRPPYRSKKSRWHVRSFIPVRHAVQHRHILPVATSQKKNNIINE